jgi:ceramide kinase
MDFDFVETHRVKEFSFRPVSRDESEDEELSAAAHVTLGDDERKSKTTQSKVRQRKHSVWNVDGEIIDEPAVHVR